MRGTFNQAGPGNLPSIGKFLLPKYLKAVHCRVLGIVSTAGNSVKRFAGALFCDLGIQSDRNAVTQVLRLDRKIILALLRLKFLPRIKVLGANCSHIAVQRIVRD